MLEWYAKLADRERRFVLFGAIGAGVLLLLWVVLTLNREITQARQRVTNKQADLAFIQQVAPELAGAGAGMVGASGESLVVLIDSSARESGLGKSLSSSEPTGDGGLRIRFERAPFDGLAAWLARISQQHGVRVESAEIESAGEAGLVNAGLVVKTG